MQLITDHNDAEIDDDADDDDDVTVNGFSCCLSFNDLLWFGLVSLAVCVVEVANFVLLEINKFATPFVFCLLFYYYYLKYLLNNASKIAEIFIIYFLGVFFLSLTNKRIMKIKLENL